MLVVRSEDPFVRTRSSAQLTHSLGLLQLPNKPRDPPQLWFVEEVDRPSILPTED